MNKLLRGFIYGFLAAFAFLAFAQLFYSFVHWDWRLMPIGEFKEASRVFLFILLSASASFGWICGRYS